MYNFIFTYYIITIVYLKNFFDFIMPFRYRLQKVLVFRIRKKDEQVIVVQKAQDEVQKVEVLIERNQQEISETRINMHKSDPIMMDSYDKFLQHLYQKDQLLQEEKNKALEVLNAEKAKLLEMEMAVKALEKHKEKAREAYIAEEKALELKNLSEVAVQKYFSKTQAKLEEEQQDLLLELKKHQNNNANKGFS